MKRLSGVAANRPVAVMWKNFGPSHHDRLRAVTRTGRRVIGIELQSAQDDYQWEKVGVEGYEVETLFDDVGHVGPLRLSWRLFRAVRRSGSRAAFFCHYEFFGVFLAACALRLTGRRVFAMLDSKFDDFPRSWRKTPIKALFLLPYGGAIAAGRRSVEYLRYLGIPAECIETGFDTLDLLRIREQAGDGPPPAFAKRPFLYVGRLVPKKNVALLIEAFADYRKTTNATRCLEVLGYGPLQGELERQAAALGVSDCVHFLGRQDRPGVAKAMRRSVALILPSLEEQFGLVVLEAMALGLAAIVSNRAGAVDLLVDNLVNGIVIDPLSCAGLVAAMEEIVRDEAKWERFSLAARETSERGSAAHFAAAVAHLADG